MRQFIFLLLVSATVSGQDFRGFSWGDFRDSIRARERAAFTREDSIRLIYTDTLAGRPVRCVYLFRAGRLQSGTYALEGFRAIEDYIATVERIRLRLQERYGAGSTSWRTPRTVIRLHYDYNRTSKRFLPLITIDYEPQDSRL